MQISGCGFACGECILLKEKKCSGCSIESDIAKDCKIIKCNLKKKLTSCLKCDERLTFEKRVCPTYKDGIRHCPIRLCILSAVE
ncbi:MAG: hypothetical protein QXL78_06815 [Methanocellales archaeon]